MDRSAETLREAVYAKIKAMGGATDEQIQQALGMGGNTERPRRRELELADRIHDGGRRARTASGRFAVVWEDGPAPRVEVEAPAPRVEPEQLSFV